MTNVLSITNMNDKNLNAGDGLDYREREEIIDALTEQSLPRVFNPNNYINKIAEEYGISLQDAKSCLKEAIAILDEKTKEKEAENEEELYAQSGYFYPSSNTVKRQKRDGMDGLEAYGTFQRLKFGLY